MESSKTMQVEKKILEKVSKKYSTGRRKTSVARVWVKPGKGEFFVNKIPLHKYFGRKILNVLINKPFVITDTEGLYDVNCTVKGGGSSGQAGAVMHGLSRAITKVDESFRAVLSKAGLLTRDSRAVERKKCGLKKARKSFQFSKR